MASTRERYQNPSVNDNINLRLLTYNNNNLSDLHEIQKVEIYFLDPAERSEANPDGMRLIDSYEGSAVVQEDTGTYLLNIEASEQQYLIGEYYDVWHVTASEDQAPSEIRQKFQIYPDLWYSTPMPVVYDFDFRFQPSKFRKGSKQYLIIEIIPNVPTAGDLRSYYENLAIVSNLKVSIEMECGDCAPQESDLRLMVDEENVDYREKRYGYYKLDTTELDCGIYNIWFKLEFGGNTYISDRHTLQIYD